jgi:hypothetical protein
VKLLALFFYIMVLLIIGCLGLIAVMLASSIIASIIAGIVTIGTLFVIGANIAESLHG